MAVPAIINGTWNKTKTYTAPNGGLTTITVVGQRALGSGRFYFELTYAGGSNRWMGLSTRTDPAWASSGSMPGVHFNGWHLAAGVYGFELDLTSSTVGRVRRNLNGGAFGGWVEIRDYQSKPLLTMSPAAGSGASANGNLSFTINTGQAPFQYDYSKDNWNIRESIYSFDGSVVVYDKSQRSFVYSGGKYLKIDPVNYVWEEVSTTLPLPAQFEAEGMSSFFLSNRLVINPTYEMPKSTNLFMGNVFSRTIDLRKLISIVTIN